VNKALGEELLPLGRRMKARFDEIVEAGYARALSMATRSTKKYSNGARAVAVG
jgi:hypothetical protein